VTEDLSTRLSRSSRGRAVTVRNAQNTLIVRDFSVEYHEQSDAYVVQISDAGCFEEAFRFLERWIARDAARRDGAYQPPPDDHVDYTDEAMYWMVERHSDRVFKDLECAVSRYCDDLENEKYYVLRTGEIVIEQRVAALRGLLLHFDSTRHDVSHAVLSPHTVEVLRCAALFPRPGDE